ncbi:lytic transglycosylase domain-containing protein [Sedimentitalea todarodis]|uniref:Lytic transglycosylase domain-containing protein n=1 Tax=Sedimentitalea todarodis TaxID=1631240 RepID=A0ABU3V8H7_9RHOB|nr:lytic transglycosylase domain-containing protein [Sedimentitalea todarodis]MDU9002476.1 lytic transglycosylase domain-containing protein [Sedimentitalea todarodis]
MNRRVLIAPILALALQYPEAAVAERLVFRDASKDVAETNLAAEAPADVVQPKTRAAPRQFHTFTARRVKPPKPGTVKRITIQIDPDEQWRPPPPAPVTKPEPAATAPVSRSEPIGKYTWFWDRISPAIASTGPGRLNEALITLNTAGEISAPRLQAMQDIAKAQGVSILRSTVGTRVSPALVLAVIAVESSGRTSVTSHAGAQGLMQLMPDTAARFGVTDSMIPADNISGGVKYLDWLMGKFNNDPILVLAGYNAGEGSVMNHAGVPPYAETRDYVPKVLAAFQVASGLCTTPPELISDGCVFHTMY